MTVRHMFFVLTFALAAAALVYRGLYPLLTCVIMPTFSTTACSAQDPNCASKAGWSILIWSVVCLLALAMCKFGP